MKNKSQYLVLMTMVIMPSLITPSCKKNKETQPSIEVPNGELPLNLVGLKLDSGYSFKLAYNLPVSGDSPEDPIASKLILLENGVELSYPHANHKSIRMYGQGQYSHWGTSLYFSASDSTNPLLNGRKYTYIIKPN